MANQYTKFQRFQILYVCWPVYKFEVSSLSRPSVILGGLILNESRDVTTSLSGTVCHYYGCRSVITPNLNPKNLNLTYDLDFQSEAAYIYKKANS